MLLSVVSDLNINTTSQYLKFDLATWAPFFDDGNHTFAIYLFIWGSRYPQLMP